MTRSQAQTFLVVNEYYCSVTVVVETKSSNKLLMISYFLMLNTLPGGLVKVAALRVFVLLTPAGL